MAKKIKTAIIILGSLLIMTGLSSPVLAGTAPCGDTCSSGSGTGSGGGSSGSGSNSKTVCDSTNLTSDQKKSCQSCDNTTTNPALNNCLQNNVIVTDIQTIVNFLSAVVGIAVVGTIIWGGIQYSTAGGSPEAVTKAKQRMTNGAIAFGAFLFIFAFLQWLIPGGVFG